MGLLNILTESGTSRLQQDLDESKAHLEQSAADYAQQVAAYTKWCDYALGLLPQLTAVAAKFSTEPFVHKTGISFHLNKPLHKVNKEEVIAACAPLKVKVEAGHNNTGLATFILEPKPKYPKLA